MAVPGELIGEYRIISQLFQDSANTIYLVDHPSLGSDPVLLTLWHNISLGTEEDRTFFQQEIQGITPILAHGEEGEKPFIITPYIEDDLEAWKALLTQIEQETQITGISLYRQRIQIAALCTVLRSYFSPKEEPQVVEEEVGEQGTYQEARTATTILPVRARRAQSLLVTRTRAFVKARQTRRWSLAILLVILVLIGGLFLFMAIPASSATVTITPASKRLTQNVQVPLTLNKALSGQQIQGRTLSYTTPTQTTTVSASGSTHHDAQAATGSLVITQADASTTLAAGTSFDDGNGDVVVLQNDTDIAPGSQTTAAARAETAGAAGNYAADTFDGYYQITSGPFIQQVIATVYVQNPQSFTGGSDASDSTYVQQADIDGAVGSLNEPGLMQTAQQQVSQMMKAGEQPVANPSCTDNQNSNHQVGDQAQNVTVSLSVTCTLNVYTSQDAVTLARVLYIQGAQASLGSGYEMDGALLIGQPQTLFDQGNGQVTLAVSADAVWVYQFSQDQLHKIVQQLTGKAQRDAVPLLQQTRGVTSVTISTALWFGNALPVSPDNITLVVKGVSGLNAPASSVAAPPGD